MKQLVTSEMQRDEINPEKEQQMFGSFNVSFVFAFPYHLKSHLLINAVCWMNSIWMQRLWIPFGPLHTLPSRRPFEELLVASDRS